MTNDILIPRKYGYSNRMGGGGDETKTNGTCIYIFV